MRTVLTSQTGRTPVGHGRQAGRAAERHVECSLCFISFVVLTFGVHASVTDLNGAFGNIWNKRTQHFTARWGTIPYFTGRVATITQRE